MEKVEVKVEGNTTELVIREGKALPLKEPEVVSIDGNIKAPVNYAKVRPPKKEKASVTFSRSEMRITYEEEPVSFYGATITGKLLMNPKLENFGINSDKLLTTEQLAKFLKMNRQHFDKVDECDALVKALTTCKVKVQTLIDKDQDQRGNKKIHYDKVVDSEIPHNFTLNLPVFIGYDKRKFKVDLCFDTADLTIKVWLESVELNDIIETDRDIIMDEELKFFNEKGLVVIEQQ